jgi:UDP-N-acetylglucosamine--N-acetylmuramyl-(pentapeptide) pyrophosphoryl-undecaprenol N-acetylglucosamine transferase
VRLLFTGGGTGGHVYPALECALGAKARGHEVQYWGSLRGQESAACGRVEMAFQGFESGPVYRLSSLRGIKSLLTLMKSTNAVVREMEGMGVDGVFATGGYAAAPVLNAARKLKVPLVVHEQNTEPGRTNLIMSRYAKVVCTAFHGSARHFSQDKVRRVGMPIRRELRESAGQGRLLQSGSGFPQVLVMGGSQGSQALNDMALSTAVRMGAEKVRWMHLTGLSHFESTMSSLDRLGVKSGYEIKSYLHAQEMADALFGCDVAVCRSGAGTMAELAAFRKPAVLVPYPAAFHDHQFFNAKEFADMGAAEIIRQEDLDSSGLESRILSWLYDTDKQAVAREKLAEWDVPDAVERILDIIEEVGTKRA